MTDEITWLRIIVMIIAMVYPLIVTLTLRIRSLENRVAELEKLKPIHIFDMDQLKE